MQVIRRMELAAANLYKEKVIRGFCHLYSGQEACCVGMKAAMREKDSAITSYRGHGWTYIMGVSPAGVLAELTGREKGCARGKGGSMHMYAPRYYGGNGIVGSGVSLGTGVAFAAKYSGDGSVCINCYGDGAANQGQTFESFNMACLYKLPIVYVCENNLYGMGTSAERSSANPNFYTRGDVMPGILVDGMDILAVKRATEFAIKYVLECTPIILEMHTYRYYGHSMSDPGLSYRSRDEVKTVREQRDPITSFRSVILQHQLATEEEIKAIDSKVKKEIDEAVKSSKADKEIPLQELTADVYFNPIEKKVRGTIGRTWDSKNVAKRPDQPVIPPKEKAKYDGYAFKIGAKSSVAEKGEEKKDANKKGKDEKKEEKATKKPDKKGDEEKK